MIKEVKRIVTLFSAEKEGKVLELAYGHENLSRIVSLKKKGCDITSHSIEIMEYVNIVTKKEMILDINRKTIRKIRKK